jgi:hypothetical protein
MTEDNVITAGEKSMSRKSFEKFKAALVERRY